MQSIDVYADISCPFAYVSLARFLEVRAQRGLLAPRLRVRAWPLELVNGAPMTGPSLVPKVAGLREEVAPDLFTGFDPARFPASTLGILAAEAAAHRSGPDAGERFSIAVRRVLFEDGVDPSAPEVLERLLQEVGLDPTEVDAGAVEADHREGVRLGVVGSPYFMVDGEGFFCPSLQISHEGDDYDISYDFAAFEEFLTRALAPGGARD